MEIAFASTDKLRFEWVKRQPHHTHTDRLLQPSQRFHINDDDRIHRFAGSLQHTDRKLHARSAGRKVNVSPAFTLILEIIAASAVLLALGEFMPKTLAKANSRFMLKAFCIPAYICYIILYPFSKTVTFLSVSLLRLSGTKINRKDQERAFTKGDLNYFIQTSIEEAGGNEENIDDEIKIFRNALDFQTSNPRLHDSANRNHRG